MPDEIVLAVSEELDALRIPHSLTRRGALRAALEGARTVAEKLRTVVAEPAHPVAGRITISIGLAMAAPGTGELATVGAQADAALYEAKRSGRNRLVIAPPPTAV